MMTSLSRCGDWEANRTSSLSSDGNGTGFDHSNPCFDNSNGFRYNSDSDMNFYRKGDITLYTGISKSWKSGYYIWLKLE